MAADPNTIHWRIKQAVRQAIIDLDLTDIGDAVYSQLFPDENGVRFPCVLLTNESMIEQPLDGDDELQRWRYPVRVWIADRESSRAHAKERTYMAARKAIIRRFDQRKLENPASAVPEAEGCTVVPEVIFDPRLPQYQHIISGVVVWVQTTEARE